MSFKDIKCLKNRMKLGLALGLADGMTEECPAGRLYIPWQFPFLVFYLKEVLPAISLTKKT